MLSNSGKLANEVNRKWVSGLSEFLMNEGSTKNREVPAEEKWGDSDREGVGERSLWEALGSFQS